MSRYKYVGNKNPWDGTVVLILGQDDQGNETSVGIGGEADISHSKYEELKDRFHFKLVKEPTNTRPNVGKKPKETVANPADKS
jgi:hypothetical protein